jgi:ribonuclease T2
MIKRQAVVIGALAAMVSPAIASAQAFSCLTPTRLARPHPELPSASQPQRLLPIGGYTLALTWHPEYCHGAANQGDASTECGGGNRFGFTLHGLWPDGVGKEWPQYCRAAPLLPEATLRATMCATPSVQLQQHEWAKHGTCMPGFDPDSYFKRSTGLYSALHFPDMDALSRERGLTVGRLASALAAVNPRLPASAIRVTVNPRGWLDELWLCLDKRFGYARCRADSGGAPATATLKIWRGAGSATPRASVTRPVSRYRDNAYRDGGE